MSVPNDSIRRCSAGLAWYPTKVDLQCQGRRWNIGELPEQSLVHDIAWNPERGLLSKDRPGQHSRHGVSGRGWGPLLFRGEAGHSQTHLSSGAGSSRVQARQFMQEGSVPSDEDCHHGPGNDGWVGSYKGIPMLFAQREGTALALASSSPFKRMSCGYVGFSDGWQDINANKKMTWT